MNQEKYFAIKCNFKRCYKEMYTREKPYQHSRVQFWTSKTCFSRCDREKLVKTGKNHFWTGKTVQNVLDSGKSVINWSFIKVLLMFGGGMKIRGNKVKGFILQ